MKIKFHSAFFFWIALSVIGTCTPAAPAENPSEPNIQPRDFLRRHMASRDELLAMEKARMIGGRVNLDAKERKVNHILMSMKRAEYQAGLRGEPFPPAMHFFHAKPLIDKSHVFDIIKMMPKGAALHVHDVALNNISWVISELTYQKGLYYCASDPIGIRFSFAEPSPSLHSSTNCSNWELVFEARRRISNDTLFDQWLFQNMSMVTEDPHVAYPDAYHAWKKFKPCLKASTGLVHSTEEVFTKYVENALLEFYNDNVQYMEVRFSNWPLLTSNRPKLSIVQKYHDIVEGFTKYHSDFYGAKFIQQVNRFSNKFTIEQDVINAIQFRKTFPDCFAGFDLVNQEDTGYTLLHYIDELLTLSEDDKEGALPFFFHAGETSWGGTPIDENLLDAILLNTSRIGHGYAITKHPVAMEMAKERGIAIEVNPISNQVLGLVSDLRNHPAAALFAQDFPLVISSDDPSVWGALPLSHDFYQAFMGLGGMSADLATLKQLALNSIKYSATTKTEKSQMNDMWTKLWDLFLDKVLIKYGSTYLYQDKDVLEDPLLRLL